MAVLILVYFSSELAAGSALRSKTLSKAQICCDVSKMPSWRRSTANAKSPERRADVAWAVNHLGFSDKREGGGGVTSPEEKLYVKNMSELSSSSANSLK